MWGGFRFCVPGVIFIDVKNMHPHKFEITVNVYLIISFKRISVDYYECQETVIFTPKVRVFKKRNLRSQNLTRTSCQQPMSIL